MSTSIHVIGFKPPDKIWENMKKIWFACEEAGVGVPEEVAKYFNYEKPDPFGVEVQIPVREWFREGGSGYELDMKDIPTDVKTIRFYMAW